MTDIDLLTIWREECARAAGWLSMSLGTKGLRLEEAALTRIGGAIEALAARAPLTPERIAELWNFSTGGSIVPPDMEAFARAVWDAAPAETFQSRVEPWMLSCFGAEISRDRTERSHRFLEEALELVQVAGCTPSEAHQLVDYVFGRPVGELSQEVGGVMVTLAALCLAQDVDMHAAGEAELARVWTKIDVVRAKHAAKPKHSPLPGAPASSERCPHGVRHPHPCRECEDGERTEAFSHDATERDVICKRMRRVARAAAVENAMPKDDVLYACLGTLLGTIAGAMERAAARAPLPQAVDRPGSAVAVPEGFWLAPMNLDDEAAEAAQMAADDFPLMGERCWYAARDSWLARHPSIIAAGLPSSLAATPPAAQAGTSGASAEVERLAGALRIYLAAGFGESTDFLAQGKARDAAVEALATLSSPAQKVGTEDADAQATPIDMVLHCPACGTQHIDAPEEEEYEDRSGQLRMTCDWTNPPHRSHLCHACEHVWRPADIPTNGVAAVKTTGKKDSPAPQPPEAMAPVKAEKLPDAFWEALQRLIENAVTQGPASMEDACLVGRYRDRLTAVADTPAPNCRFIASGSRCVRPCGNTDCGELKESGHG